MRTTIVSHALSVVLVLGLAACQDGVDPNATEPARSPATTAESEPTFRTTIRIEPGGEPTTSVESLPTTSVPEVSTTTATVVTTTEPVLTAVEVLFAAVPSDVFVSCRPLAPADNPAPAILECDPGGWTVVYSLFPDDASAQAWVRSQALSPQNCRSDYSDATTTTACSPPSLDITHLTWVRDGTGVTTSAVLPYRVTGAAATVAAYAPKQGVYWGGGTRTSSGGSPSVVEGVVARTCGAVNADGTYRGDCRLSQRTAPSSTQGEKVGEFSEGARVEIVCQAEGEAVSSSANGRTSTVWAKLVDGTFVAQIYIDAPLDSYRVERPC